MTTEKLTKKNSLVVAEAFYSIQGEGKTTGTPAVFLRLAGCNLLCKSESWVCDSIEVWQKGTRKAFWEVLNNDQLEALRNGAHLVITGGEPMLHQDSIWEYVMWLRIEKNLWPFIEIETNGTITPKPLTQSFVDQWNCSPKLPNSGESKIRRFNDVALLTLQSMPNIQFKFVIEQESDLVDMLQEYHQINPKYIWLMPAGETQEELNKTRPIVIELAKLHGYHYSDRLHIVAWNKKTGV